MQYTHTYQGQIFYFTLAENKLHRMARRSLAAKSRRCTAGPLTMEPSPATMHATELEHILQVREANSSGWHEWVEVCVVRLPAIVRSEKSIMTHIADKYRTRFLAAQKHQRRILTKCAVAVGA